MRVLTGVMLLLIAAAAVLPQSASQDDVLHGRPKSEQEFEIRPGIHVCAQYGKNGSVSRMFVRPMPRFADAWRDSIPMDTIKSIMRQVIQLEGRSRYSIQESFLAGCRGEEISSLQNLTSGVAAQHCTIDNFDVHLAVIDFRRPPDDPHTLDSSVEIPSNDEIAEWAAVLTAQPSEWCAR